MASDVQQTYYEWKHEEEDSQEPSISQIIDHGSISFGRFAFESLSWEKRSVFTHNERQEELEKFKSPGSVAQKKAYFEEYYKKIRALKAMQNQQTEISLEYGANGSISSQTGDEDEPPLPSTCAIAMPKSISETPSDDHTAEITFEKKCGEVLEHECVAAEFVEDSAAKESIEEPHESRREIKEKNYIFDSENSVRGLSTGSSEGIKQNENSRAKWRYDNDAYLKMEPDLTSSIVCSADPTTVSNAVEVDFVPVDDLVLEKNKLIVHKPKEGPTSVVMLKEQATSVRYLSKSVNKSLPAKIQSSMGSKQLHKSIDKAHIDRNSSKTISNKARSCKKTSFVTSHRPPTEVQNKVTFSRPGPISKERKGAVPTNISEHVLRSQSKASNGRNINPKGKFRAQGELKQMEKATQNSIKNRALQSKSVGHGEFKMNLDNRGVTVEGRTATEQLKTRSINLPSRSSHGPNGDISYQSVCLSVENKTKKATALTARKYEGKGSKITTLRQSGNIKVDTVKKQMSTVEIEKHGRPNGVRQSFIDGKKSRKENPRWR